MRAQDKDRVLSELESRVVDEIGLRGGAVLEEVLAESVYREAQRVHRIGYEWGRTIRLCALAAMVCGVSLALPPLPSLTV